jgi:hypothetical protein
MKPSDSRKKRKELGLDSPPRRRLIGGEVDLPTEDGERKRGRPRTQSTAAVSFSRLPTPEPVITKVVQEEKSLFRYSNEFEEEYEHFAAQYGDIGQNRVQKEAWKRLEMLQNDFSLLLYTETKERKESKLDTFLSAKVFVMLHEQYPPSNFVAQQRTVSCQRPFKTYNLIATQTIPSAHYISEIKGTICSRKELHQTDNLLPLYPALEGEMDVEEPPLLMPPFVFPFYEDCWLDSRQFGSGSGRFVRSFCGNPALADSVDVNAILKLVYLIPNHEVSKYGKLYPEDLPALINDSPTPPIYTANKVRLCLFSSKEISANQEIIIQASNVYYFPCVCNGHPDCKVSKFVDDINTYSKTISGGTFLLNVDPDIPFLADYEKYQEIDASRVLELEEYEELQRNLIPKWCYDSDEDRLNYTRNYYYNSDDYVDQSDISDSDSDSEEDMLIDDDPQELLVRQQSESKIVSLFEGKETPKVPPADSKQEEGFKIPAVDSKKEEPIIEKPAIEPRRVSLRDFMLQQSTPTPTQTDLGQVKTNSPEDLDSAQSITVEDSNLETPTPVKPSEPSKSTKETSHTITNSAQAMSVVDLATLAKTISQQAPISTPQPIRVDNSRFEVESSARTSPILSVSTSNFVRTPVTPVETYGYTRSGTPVAIVGNRQETPSDIPKIGDDDWKRDGRDAHSYLPRDRMEPSGGYRPVRDSFPPRNSRDLPDRRDTPTFRDLPDRRDTPTIRDFPDRRDVPSSREHIERRDPMHDRRDIPPPYRDRMDDRLMTPVPDRRERMDDRMGLPNRDDRREMYRIPDRDPGIPLDMRGSPRDVVDRRDGRPYLRDDRMDTPDPRRSGPTRPGPPPPYGYPPYDRDRRDRYPPPPSRHGYYPPNPPYRSSHEGFERERYPIPPPPERDERRDDRDRYGPPPDRDYRDPRSFRGGYRGRGDWRGRGR